jgi:drug/metabolite transporter (DMT)-like permease
MTMLWAVNFIVVKIALRELPALFTAGVRTGLAGVFMVPVYLWQARRLRHPGWKKSDVPVLIALGLLGVALNQLFFTLGIGRTSVAHAAVIIALSPVIVLFIASRVGLERLTLGRVAGMLLALAGVLLLQLGPVKNAATLHGDLLIFLGALSFSIFTVMGKRVSGSFSSITLNTFAYVGGGLTLLPLVLWQGGSMQFAGVSVAAWASVIYMALFPSVLCFLIYYYALTHIPASRVSAFSYAQPLIATALAVPLLGERPGAGLVAGGALVLTGVIMAERL